MRARALMHTPAHKCMDEGMHVQAAWKFPWATVISAAIDRNGEEDGGRLDILDESCAHTHTHKVTHTVSPSGTGGAAQLYYIEVWMLVAFESTAFHLPRSAMENPCLRLTPWIRRAKCMSTRDLCTQKKIIKYTIIAWINARKWLSTTLINT